MRRNALRTFLTALGIIIGIASVIVMMEIGEGSREAIAKTISGMGSNTILIMPGTAASGGVSFGAGTGTTLTVDDAEAILRECPAVRAVAPLVRARGQVIYGNRNWVPQNIYGTTPSYLDVRDWTTLAAGEPFANRDVRSGTKVALLGQTLVRELFQGENPIGKEIRIQNASFKVMGVLASKGANMMGMDQDDIVIAPLRTVKNRISGSNSSSTTSSAAGNSSASATSTQTSSNAATYPSSGVQLYPDSSNEEEILNRRLTNVDQIQVSARSAGDIQSALDQMSELLRERHRLQPDEPDDFNLRDMTELAAAFSSTNQLMSKLLLCVALISLIVGGIGIMNTMLVSVTERTREIGLRLAVGARQRDIRRQFLSEAVVLCLSGGISGILLGRGVSYLVHATLGWSTRFSLSAVIAAFSVAVLVGVVFGYYPAVKAAKLDPIEALRRE